LYITFKYINTSVEALNDVSGRQILLLPSKHAFEIKKVVWLILPLFVRLD